VLVGLGTEAPAKVSVEVIWPDGSEERFADLETRRYHELRPSEASPEVP
jgi:hypothetical protein